MHQEEIWNDNDNDNDNAGQSLFGRQTTAAKPEVLSPAPTFVTPTQPTPELHQAPALSSSNLFGDPSSTSASAPTTAAATGSAQTARPTAIPPAPYSSLFGGAASSSSSSSESDSDDGGGLFGT